jgi:hypothetical protein
MTVRLPETKKARKIAAIAARGLRLWAIRKHTAPARSRHA